MRGDPRRPSGRAAGPDDERGVRDAQRLRAPAGVHSRPDPDVGEVGRVRDEDPVGQPADRVGRERDEPAIGIDEVDDGPMHAEDGRAVAGERPALMRVAWSRVAAASTCIDHIVWTAAAGLSL